MSDYSELCARLRHNCECDSETMYQCDSCTASYAIESQAREIAELKAKLDKFKWRFEEWERKGYLALADERDALRTRAEAAEKDAARYRWLMDAGSSNSPLARANRVYARWNGEDGADGFSRTLDAMRPGGGA